MMRAARGTRLVLLTLTALVVAGAAALPARSSVRVDVEDLGNTVLVETRTVDDITYFELDGLARAAGASRHWNATTRKTALLIGQRRLSLVVDGQFATLDRSVVNLYRPVLMLDGTLWVPPRFLTGPLADALHCRFDWVPGDEDAVAVPLGPAVVSLGLEDRVEGTAVIIGTSSRAVFEATSRSRGLVTVFIENASLPDSLGLAEGDGMVEGVEVATERDGVIVRIATTSEAREYTADDLGPPYRIEVLVQEGAAAALAGSSIPSPALRPQRQTGGRLEEEDDDGLRTVMIDPGHGGNDTGSVGPTGLAEKDVTLAVARELARELQRYGYYVFMTRSSDSFVPLSRRGEIANMAEADVFVSLQCGAWHSSAASGFQVHVHSRGGGPRRVAAGGLVRDFPGAVDAQSEGYLWDRAHRGYTGDSRTLARRIHDALAAAIDSPDRGIASGEVAVLAGCAMPAALVEVGYITNRGEEELLADPGHRQQIARGIARGIATFMQEREEAEE